MLTAGGPAVRRSGSVCHAGTLRLSRPHAFAQALIDFGIRRVNVAMIDPHPLNQGRGIEMMRRAGIDVRVGVERSRVARFISAHLNIDPRYQPLQCCQEFS